jgi:hypothetical protein
MQEAARKVAEAGKEVTREFSMKLDGPRRDTYKPHPIPQVPYQTHQDTR